MNTIALADLAPILAAVLGPMMALAVVVMRYQHLDSTKTRDLINDVRIENRDLIDEVRIENRDLIDEVRTENRDLIRENRDLINEVRTENREGLREVNRNLADARERLARIEGHFGIGAPRADADEGGHGEADAA